MNAAALDEWKSWTDADYIRAMADIQDKQVGAPVADHTARLRFIAARIEALEGIARAIAGWEGNGRPPLTWWVQSQVVARKALEGK